MSQDIIYFKFFPYVNSTFAVSLLTGGAFEYQGGTTAHSLLPVEERIETFTKNGAKMKLMIPPGLGIWFEREMEDVMNYLRKVDEVLSGGTLVNSEGEKEYIKGSIPDPEPRPDFAAMVATLVAGTSLSGGNRMDYTGYCGACYSETPSSTALNIRLPVLISEGHDIQCLKGGDYCLVHHIRRVIQEEQKYHRRVASLK